MDISDLSTKSNLAKLKAEVDKTDVEQIKDFFCDLSKPISVVNNDVAKTTVYDRLVTKVNILNTSLFVLETQ